MVLIVRGLHIELIDDYKAIEEQLTLLEHRVRVALGQVVIPKGGEQNDEPLLNVLYLMAAAMVGADGRTDANEIAMAEAMGKKLVPGFDPIDFRAVCRGQVPPLNDLVDSLSGALEREPKTILLEIFDRDRESGR